MWLAFLLVLAGCAAPGDQSEVLRGSLTYRERVALPPDAAVEVRLSDVSRQDAAAQVIAETTFATAGKQVPIPFELSYDASAIQPNHTYAVRSTIRSGGRLIFTTDQAYHVITRGNPRQVDLSLMRVRAPGSSDSASLSSQSFRTAPSESGRLAAAGDRLRFFGCGQQGDGILVDDLANGEGEALLRELGAGGTRITVLLRLDGNRIREIRYAGLEGPGCDRLPPDGELEARGNEPFWHVRVDGTQARLTTPEMRGGVEYSHGKWSRPDAGWRFEALRTDPTGGSDQLVLELTEERCTDSMSGARYPFKAVLARGGKRAEGCALEGRGAVSAEESR
jgi:putative lipoprotein